MRLNRKSHLMKWKSNYKRKVKTALFEKLLLIKENFDLKVQLVDDIAHH